jgi:hypothetical protein
MRPSLKLFAALYPFGAGAMWLYCYFLSLILSWIGWPVLTPLQALLAGIALGLPATWAYAAHITRLMRKAEEEMSAAAELELPEQLFQKD